MTVMAIVAGFTVAVALLISPVGMLTPENAGNVWAPYGTVLAAYGPFYYRKNLRAAFAVVGSLTLIVARVWEPSLSVITIGVKRVRPPSTMASITFQPCSFKIVSMGAESRPTQN